MIDRPALRYHGSKFRLAPWIISHLREHSCYVEPYGGGAAVLLQKQPAAHEVYNDIDGQVVGFFRVLRENPDELIYAIKWTPHSRQEFLDAWDDPCEPGTIEAARRLYVRSYQTFGNGTGEKSPTWRFTKGKDSRSPIERLDQAEKLYAIARRLRAVQIEHDDALTIMHRFDGHETLVYADPPYVTSTRTNSTGDYVHELTDEQHVALAETLKSLSAMVVLSGYESSLYDELYGEWTKVVRAGFSDNGSSRKECLWLSPNMQAVQLAMFGNLGDADNG